MGKKPHMVSQSLHREKSNALGPEATQVLEQKELFVFNLKKKKIKFRTRTSHLPDREEAPQPGSILF